MAAAQFRVSEQGARAVNFQVSHRGDFAELPKGSEPVTVHTFEIDGARVVLPKTAPMLFDPEKARKSIEKDRDIRRLPPLRRRLRRMIFLIAILVFAGGQR
jgi:hypothetical protein